SVYPSFTTIAPIISGAQLSLQPATLAYGSSGITTLYIALLDPQRNIIIDDGTGSTLDKTLTVSSTDTAAPTSSYSCSSGGSAILTTTSYTTIPAATGDAIHTTGCLTSSQIAVTYGTTRLATTTLNVTGLGAEAPLNSVMYPFGGGLQSAMASDGKIWTFSASASEPAQSLDPLTGATSSVYNNSFGGCCGAPAPTSNVLLGSDGNFYFFGSGNSGPVAQQFQPATQSYATCYLSYPGASYSTKITSIAQTSDGTLWGTDAADGLIVEVPASSVTTGCSTITPATVAQPLQPAPPTVVTQSGNSATLPTGTYSVKIQWQDYSGLTATSPATQITITNAGDSLLVSAPPNYSGRSLGTSANGYNVLLDSGSGYVQLSNADCQNGSASGAIPLYVNCLIESVTSTATPAPATSTTHAHPASILNDNGTLYVSDATAGTISTLSSGTFTPLAFANTAESYMPNLAAIDSDHIAYEELPGDNGGLYRIGVLELAGLHQADFSLISSQEFSAPGSLIVAGNGGMYYVSQDGSGNTGIEHAVCACAPNAAPVFNTSPTFTPAGFQTNATLYDIVADKTGSLWIPETYGSNASLVRFMLP
ncbi:MAG TPA: hypothetical protein VFL13_03705, partial [Candidatus Baltobacteraceae bacterium]|nr:hypothetical protein [Candidatus Baltobacteraceae bacterium]